MKELKSSLLRRYFLLMHCEYTTLSFLLFPYSNIVEGNIELECASCRQKQDEESITVHEVAPASSAPCPPPTKTLRRKLGDFFTLKKRRALKSETSQEGRPKKASIADFIRPLRDKERDKDKVKEHDKENEKEKGREHPSSVTGETAVQEAPASGAPPLRAEVAPPRRALREGKSQSLILLSGSSAAGTTNSRNAAKVSAARVHGIITGCAVLNLLLNPQKQLEGQHSFEQKLHLMLQRIGVSKPQPEETQVSVPPDLHGCCLF